MSFVEWLKRSPPEPVSAKPNPGHPVHKIESSGLSQKSGAQESPLPSTPKEEGIRI